MKKMVILNACLVGGYKAKQHEEVDTSRFGK